MSDIKDDSSGIVQRLEELNQWQEEQKRILFEKQNNQRKLLGMEHRKMYETLGIYHAVDTSLSNDDDDDDESSEDAVSSCSEADVGVSALEQTIDDEVANENQSKPKRPFLRRKQGLINRFKIDPDQLRLNNLPPYKYSSAHPSLKRNLPAKKPPQKNKNPPKDSRPISKAILKLKTSEKPKPQPNLDALEQKFQKSLISSQTACNSTPDMKSQSLSTTKETPEPISWAKILDPENVKPIEIPNRSSSCVEDETADNMSIFELLEQKAKEGSFDLNSSYIQRFLKSTQKYTNQEQTDSSVSLKLTPIPYEVQASSKSLISDSSDAEYDVEEVHDDSTPKRTVRVRFSDDSKQHDTNQSTILDNSEASQVFEEFKKQLFANQSDSTVANESQNAFTQDILQKTELIRTRLTELEAEINSFKKNNLELVKLKQQHELEKAHFEQERSEAAEKLNDERIQMEIYLHDERMKIEEERKKMEKQIRHQKSLVSGKDKKEIAKLQEEIETLHKEMRKKEESHVAAQSRLRAQVRNLEKDVRQLNNEIEVLNKENKRLEAENLKINRQTNNKMLQEINRNIAKLAPKLPTGYTEEIAPARTSSLSKSTKSKPAPVQARRKSTETKRKTSPVRRRHSTVQSSEEDELVSSGSFDDSSHHERANSKVTFAKSPTSPPPNQNKQSNEKDNSPPSIDATFKREIRNPDGSKDIWYPNGNLKKISADGMIIRMLYFNKDIKETNINEGTVKYYYAETNTWHTTYIDGLEILEFPNGQTEHRYKDGKIEVHFPNNSIKITDPADENKAEEWRFADGTNLIQMRNGDRILLMANGQKEIHTALNKRREYPDGTVKLLYPDGSQETRYSNGRVRLKDKDGNLVMDTETVLKY